MSEAKEKLDRSYSIDLYISKEELSALEQRMQQAGIKNRSYFMREILNKGYILQTDTSTLNKVMFLLSNIANNMNQIARYVNVHQRLYTNDIEQIRQGYMEIAKEISAISDVIISPKISACEICGHNSLLT